MEALIKHDGKGWFYWMDPEAKPIVIDPSIKGNVVIWNNDWKPVDGDKPK